MQKNLRHLSYVIPFVCVSSDGSIHGGICTSPHSDLFNCFASLDIDMLEANVCSVFIDVDNTYYTYVDCDKVSKAIEANNTKDIRFHHVDCNYAIATLCDFVNSSKTSIEYTIALEDLEIHG